LPLLLLLLLLPLVLRGGGNPSGRPPLRIKAPKKPLLLFSVKLQSSADVDIPLRIVF